MPNENSRDELIKKMQQAQELLAESDTQLKALKVRKERALVEINQNLAQLSKKISSGLGNDEDEKAYQELIRQKSLLS